MGNTAPFPDAPLVPAVGQGIVVSDARGVFKGGGTLSLGGMIIEQSIVGTALVNHDGTGSITYDVSIGGVHAFYWDINFLILDGGDEIWGMPYDTGSALLCTLKRMGEAKSDKHDDK
ncbi:MAG: hypothetical protein LAO21_07335 [Acidobacteriia bacterium]|nr:hypothetical protein [Terriglobia bacterium]